MQDSYAVAQLFESRKVAPSVPDGFFGIFLDIILPAALWSTHRVTELSTINVGRRVKAADA
jgi:hypothetical protein